MPREFAPGIEIMVRRGDFLAAAKAKKAPRSSLTIQARPRNDDGPARIGFTCSKKLGNAVARNRAKRRLRAASRLILAPHARPGWDYVLIGRPGATINQPFEMICRDIETALDTVHGAQTPSPKAKKQKNFNH